jgi:hypothetical protein
VHFGFTWFAIRDPRAVTAGDSGNIRLRVDYKGRRNLGLGQNLTARSWKDIKVLSFRKVFLKGFTVL